MSDIHGKAAIPAMSLESSQPARRSGLYTSLVSIACFLRGLPLFFGATPKTPLRVLCLIAFDTLHVLRRSKPLPRHRIRVLATVLDFAASTNAALDHKAFCPNEYEQGRQSLEDAGVFSPLQDYLRQLRELERRRPAPGGDHRRFDEIRSYREAVVRLSLGVVATIAFDHEPVAEGVEMIDGDENLATLFRIVMLCQIIDDVLDYREDVSAALPSFLTASAALRQGLQWTADAARSYGACRALRPSEGVFPFRVALLVVFALARLVIRAGRWRHRMAIATSSGAVVSSTPTFGVK